MKVLYIHIGTPKTATTAIQEFCLDNQEALNQKGYCYPVFPFEYPDAPKTRNGHFLVGVAHDFGLEGIEEKEQKEFREGLDTVNSLFENYDNVILSDEIIWRSTFSKRKSLWEELKKESEAGGFQVKVIVYLRRQDTFCVSWWNQLVKMGTRDVAREGLKVYMENVPPAMQLDYYKKLEKISIILGRDNVLVRRFGKEYFEGGSIYTDFLQTVGLKLEDGFTVAKDIRNYSLEGNNHEIKRILNSLQMNPVQNKFILQVLTDCSQVSEKMHSFAMLSKEEIQEFMERYEEGNRRIVQDYLKGEGELFHIGEIKKPVWKQENPYMQEDILRFIGKGFIYLLEENHKLKAELKLVKADIDRLKRDTSRHKQLFKKLRHPFRAVAHRVKGRISALWRNK